MRRKIIYLTSLLLIGGVAVMLLVKNWKSFSSSSVALSDPSAPSQSEALVAAPGRVEPVSEEIKVGSEISGKLKAVRVEEGDPVRRGQIIALLENSDYQAQVASAAARLSQKEAEWRRVVNGARDQERREAWAAVKEAEAVMENARAEMERRQTLFDKGVIAREEADRTARAYQVAKARYDAAVQRHALVDADAREEDRSRAQADLDLARAQLDEARARLEKTIVRSPIAGVILRKHMRAGESVSNSSSAPMPIVTVADASTLCVRVDIDETDVSKIRIGQRAYVRADAYGAAKFWGRVVRIGQVLGKKNVRTDEPAERVDTKILETLIELEDGHELPTGLRVDAFIGLGEDPPASNRSAKRH